MNGKRGKGWIVDASVILKWFLPAGSEPDAALARQAIGVLPLRTTTLAFYETGNILTRVSGMNSESIATCLSMVSEICGPPIDLHSDDFLMVAETARKNKLTFYDASYVAIAKRLGRSVLSADSDLLDPGLAFDLPAALA